MPITLYVAASVFNGLTESFDRFYHTIFRQSQKCLDSLLHKIFLQFLINMASKVNICLMFLNFNQGTFLAYILLLQSLLRIELQNLIIGLRIKKIRE